MGESHTSLFYTLLDAVIAVSFISIIILLIKCGIMLNDSIRNKNDHNTTITANMTDTEYYGYYDGNRIQYGGEMTGTQVYAAILDSTAEVVKVNNVDIAQQKLGKYSLLQYIKQIDSEQLKTIVKIDKNYYLYYALDSDGNVTYISYNEKD